jgi:hypothetical protein
VKDLQERVGKMEKPVGELLTQWQSYITNISSNLIELSDELDFQTIKSRARDNSNGYTGLTKIKADQCVDSAGALWQYLTLLSEVVEKAKNLYSKNSFLNNTENAVRELLENDSIVIKTERISINERDLISGENLEKKATPGELLKYMQESFESVRSTVSEISKAEDSAASRLSDIKTEIAALNDVVKRIGINNIPAFDTDKIAKIESDPLQGSMELDKLVYSVEKYRASIRSVEQQYNNISETLDKVKAMLSELRELAVKSKDAAASSRKIFGNKQVVKPVIGEDILKSLEDWFQVLEKKLSEGSLDAVRIGISRLEQECSMKLEVEKENYWINSKDYNEWLDLKGQFRALCAKLDAMKAKGMTIDNSFYELMKNTQTALFAEKVILDNCRQLINKFSLSLKR